GIVDRVLRAVKLDPALYREVGADQSKTIEAMVVTGVAALISGLGGVIFAGQGIGSWLLGAILAATLGLAIGTGIIFLVGKLFKGQGQYIELFRGLGYAYAPTALGIIPFVGGIVGSIWSIVCAIRAVREINRVPDGAAIATVLIPVAVVVVLALIVAALLGLALMGMMQGG
ncbi:MAG: YIP1 family protein, partial [Acidimicrobiia bacterium]